MKTRYKTNLLIDPIISHNKMSESICMNKNQIILQRTLSKNNIDHRQLCSNVRLRPFECDCKCACSPSQRSVEQVRERCELVRQYQDRCHFPLPPLRSMCPGNRQSNPWVNVFSIILKVLGLIVLIPNTFYVTQGSQYSYVNNCDQTRHTLQIKLTYLLRDSMNLVETSTVHFTCCACEHGDWRRERCVVIYVIIIIGLLYYVLSFHAKHEYARTNLNATYEI